MFSFLLARLAERTTWLGLTAFVSASGVALAPEMANAVTAAGMGVAGLIGALTKG